MSGVPVGVLASGVGASATYESVVLADSPSFYWRLGESSGTSAVDATANGRDGTYVNTPTLGVTGAVSGDTAVTFNGSNQRVSLTYAAMVPASPGVTIEFWSKHTTTSTVAVCGNFNDGSTECLQVEFNTTQGGAGNIRAYLAQGGLFNYFYTTGLSLNDGEWRHFVVTTDFTSSSGEIYINGSAATVTRAGSSLGTYANWQYDWIVGARNQRGTINEWFPGSIDEFAFYPSILSSTQVAAHYAAA